MKSLSSIANSIQARLHGQDLCLPSVVIDSRQVKVGDCFVAIKGENYDGHDFIAEAIRKGAKVIVATRAPQNAEEKAVSFLEVKDTLWALGQMASLWRDLHAIPLIGITGSCGKTTVKEMIAAICQKQGKTLVTQGNLNNHIGLPLMLLQLDPTYQYAVIEMGASHVGEIRYLGQILKPDVAVITNVAPAHLEGFGSIENVAKAKAEIYETLSPEGTALLNSDEHYHSLWTEIIGKRTTLSFGLTEKAQVNAQEIVLEPSGVRFKLNFLTRSYPVKMHVPGQHTVMNALAAATAGVALGFSEANIVAGLEAFEGVSGRLCRYQAQSGAIVIDDSYNANPGSMKAALEVLAHYPGERLFVMGNMAELGTNAITYHTEIGQYAKEKGINKLFAFGKLTEHAVKAFGEGGILFACKEELVEKLKAQLSPQMVILVKGSRSAKMEEVISALLG